MLSQTVEHALRAVVYLAKDNITPRTTAEIAKATKVPQAYLSKFLQNLNHSGIVHSQRGIGGDMTLTNSAGDLTILEVVNAVDPIKRIKTCPLDLATHGGIALIIGEDQDDVRTHFGLGFVDGADDLRLQPESGH